MTNSCPHESNLRYRGWLTSTTGRHSGLCSSILPSEVQYRLSGSMFAGKHPLRSGTDIHQNPNHATFGIGGLYGPSSSLRLFTSRRNRLIDNRHLLRRMGMITICGDRIENIINGRL